MDSIESIQDIHHKVKTTLYSTFVLCLIFFFYKLIKHVQRNHFFVMILILSVPLFLRTSIKLLGLFNIYSSDLLSDFARILGNFASCWMVCLTIYHYSMLKLFKGKFRKYPYKEFTIGTVLLSLVIAFIANLEFMQKDGRDYFIIDTVASLILWFIFFQTWKYREEIKFGPYSIIRESASKLAIFALFETLFATVYLIKTTFMLSQDCSSHSTFCEIFHMLDTVIYQLWLSYPIFFNWKMASERSAAAVEVQPRSQSVNEGARSGSFLTFTSDKSSSMYLSMQSIQSLHGMPEGSKL